MLLTAQQAITMVGGKSLSRFILQPAAFVVGTLLAPQVAQAQTPVPTPTQSLTFPVPTLTATGGDGQVTLNRTAPSLPSGYGFELWSYNYKESSVEG